jgi:hypothetical protein
MAGVNGPNGAQPKPPALNQFTRAVVRASAPLPGIVGDVNTNQNGQLQYNPNNPNGLGRYLDSIGDRMADTISNPKKALPHLSPWGALFQ